MGSPTGRHRALVDFSIVPRRLRTAAGVLAAVTLGGCIVDGALRGLTFQLMGRWAGAFAVTFLIAAAVITALHAAVGADRASRRGERLSSPDVGITPRRLNAVPDDSSDGHRR